MVVAIVDGIAAASTDDDALDESVAATVIGCVDDTVAYIGDACVCGDAV